MTDMTNCCLLCWKEMGDRAVCPHCGNRMKSPSERRPDALPPLTLLQNRYLIGEVLGKGGFGITYSAWDTAYRHRIALKELFPASAVYRDSDGITVSPVPERSDLFEQLRRSFQQEISLLQMLSSQPKMLGVYDQFFANGTICYTMEFLDGIDLEKYRKSRGPMSWEELKPIVFQLLDILEGIHSKNLIHRDISPDNIFLIGNGEVRLIDFGAARTYQGATHFTVQKKEELAPLEQFSRDGNQRPWTDVYSLSVTIYLLLTGKLPAKVYDRINKKVPLIPLKRLAPNTPDAVARAVERGLSIYPEDRFSSARDFRAALEVKSVQPMQYWLYGKRGHYAGRRKPLPVDRRLRMGRGTDNDVFIPDETKSVSRNQCELYVTADNVLFVRDLGSRNGTILNGKRIGGEWVPVPPGSTLSLGLEVFELVQLKAEGR